MVVVLGGALSFWFRNVDAAREERRRLDEYRAGFVGELWNAYHRIKAVRRTLRAQGFAFNWRGLTSGEFSEEQCREYNLQMKELSEAQLSLETLKRQVDDDHGLVFGHVEVGLSASLRVAEKYVNDVVGDWERRRHEVRTGADRASVLGMQERLSAFLGSPGAKGGMAELSNAVNAAALLVRKLRLSPDSFERG